MRRRRHPPQLVQFGELVGRCTGEHLCGLDLPKGGIGLAPAMLDNFEKREESLPFIGIRLWPSQNAARNRRGEHEMTHTLGMARRVRNGGGRTRRSGPPQGEAIERYGIDHGFQIGNHRVQRNPVITAFG
jgi:hypothetical protein